MAEKELELAYASVLKMLSSEDYNECCDDINEKYRMASDSQRFQLLLNFAVDESQPIRNREVAANLLEVCFEILDFKKMHSELSPSEQTDFMNKLVDATTANVSQKFADSMAEAIVLTVKCLLTKTKDCESLSGLHLMLLEWSMEPSVHLLRTCMRIYTCVPNIFHNTDDNVFLKNLAQIASENLNEKSTKIIRSKTTSAVLEFVDATSEANNMGKKICELFSSMLPQMIPSICSSVAVKGNSKILKHLINIIDNCSDFVSDHLESIFIMSFYIMSLPNLEAHWNFLVLEGMVILTENLTSAVEEKAQKYIVKLVPVIADLLIKLDIDIDWAEHDEKIKEEDLHKPHDVGLMALYRLVSVLNGKMLFELLTQNIILKINKGSWQCVCVMLNATATVISAGFNKFPLHRIEQIASSTMLYIRHDDPRVRFSACNLLTEMSAYKTVTSTKRFHARIIPLLLKIAEKDQVPRVVMKAMETLILFIQECDTSILALYTEVLINTLASALDIRVKEFLNSKKLLALESVLSAINVFIKKFPEESKATSEQTMKCVTIILKKALDEGMTYVRGQAVECLGLLVLSSGFSALTDDLKDIIHLITPTNVRNQLKAYDPQITNIMIAWTYICQTHTEEFSEFLPTIMKYLSNWGVTNQLDEVMSRIQDPDFDVDIEAFIEQKYIACDMFSTFSVLLQKKFAIYAVDIMPLIKSMMGCEFYDIHLFAVDLLPPLLRCFKEHNVVLMKEMWNLVKDEVLHIILHESDLKTQMGLIKTLAKCAEVVDRACTDNDSMSKLINLVDSKMAAYLKHMDELQQTAASNNSKNNKSEFDALKEYNDDPIKDIAASVVHLVRVFIKIYCEDFLTHFEKLSVHFLTMIECDRLWPEIRSSLFVFTDLIHYCGAAAVKNAEVFINALPLFTKHESPYVRQAAIYALGIVIKYGGVSVLRKSNDYINIMLNIVTSRHRLTAEDERLNIFDYCLGGVARILETDCSCLADPYAAFCCWLSFMPAKNEYEERLLCYKFLCKLIDGNHYFLFVDETQVARLFRVIADGFRYDIVGVRNHEGMRLISFMKKVQNNKEIFMHCIESLSNEQQLALRSAHKAFIYGTKDDIPKK